MVHIRSASFDKDFQPTPKQEKALKDFAGPAGMVHSLFQDTIEMNVKINGRETVVHIPKKELIKSFSENEMKHLHTEELTKQVREHMLKDAELLDPEEKLKFYERAANVDDKELNARANYELAMRYSRKGDDKFDEDKAFAHFEKAIMNGDKFTRKLAEKQLGNQLGPHQFVRLGDRHPDKADYYYEKAIALNFRPKDYDRLAVYYDQQGQPQKAAEARARFQKLIDEGKI